MLETDASQSVETALERLHTAAEQKIQAGVICDPVPRVLDAPAAGTMVTVELDWGGLDKGILTASVPWEEYGSVREGFLLCVLDDADALWSMAAGKYVTVELGDDEWWSGDWHATLRARATSIGAFERLRIRPDGSGESGAVAIRSLGNNRLVVAEFGYPGDGWASLRARAKSVGPWARFIIR